MNISSLEFEREGAVLKAIMTSQQDVLSISDSEVRLAMLGQVLDEAKDPVDLVVLDLEHLSRINSAVLGFFVQLHKELDSRNIRFGVIHLSPSIAKVMELTRLTHIILDL
ncbi:MAG TPA: STAS domain-containing protein [bacterium]|mgnify:CR=1 FL=1|nr:STAS domain-containing protein [bacterium]